MLKRAKNAPCECSSIHKGRGLLYAPDDKESVPKILWDIKRAFPVFAHFLIKRRGRPSGTVPVLEDLPKEDKAYG